ncbi:MAG: EF-Tu/IF-2/RF-3 family GTPase, partial [Vicinamibacterales bacterium]
TRFDTEAYRGGRQTPVFFGSALNDFGVDPFLRALLTLAPSPAARPSDIGMIQPTDPEFSGFVFKMQANMNPRHRDRVAFVRVCSGRLAKDMSVVNERLDSTLRLSRVYRFFGRDRESVPEAYPGDVIGLVNPGRLAIGDTLYAGRKLRFPPIPQFPAERFAYLRPADVRHKRFDDAVRQLEEEGLMQVFIPQTGLRHPIIGVVGSLQFDVIEARLQSEYGIRCVLDALPHVAARWPVRAGDDTKPLTLTTSGVVTIKDRQGRDVLLFESAWELRFVTDANPTVRLLDSM